MNYDEPLQIDSTWHDSPAAPTYGKRNGSRDDRVFADNAIAASKSPCRGCSRASYCIDACPKFREYTG